MNDAIRVDRVTVRYGRRVAVEEASLTVPHGSVYALLGRNGAGKSSLVRCILGQLRPQRGSVALFGDDVWRRRTALMDRVGVVSEEADAPPETRVRDLGVFTARLYSRWEQGAFDERLKRFAIDPRARFGELSKGQKKQVMLALALATSPDLVILDDPTLGLDVVAKKSLFEEVIADMADRGITVLITTHDLGPLETIADRIGMLRAGRIVVDEGVDELKGRFRRVRSRDAGTLPPALTVASSQPWGSGIEAVVSNYDGHDVDGEVSPMTLEEIFIAVAGEQG